MATQFEIDSALMAGMAYRSTRADINRFPLPQGWSEIPLSHVTLPSGFEAVTFTTSTDLVISYTGTGTAVDWIANIALANGWAAAQLKQAALYYLEVKAANTINGVAPNITFTGHSLGGGLASLMAVMFDKPAVTFDQAPFANSASTSIRDSIVTYLNASGYNNSQLTALAPELFSYSGSGTRTANVTGYYVQGEALQYLPYSTIGSLAQLDQTSTGMGLTGPVNLHSQALLSAFLENKAFENVTVKLPDLLAMVFDGALFYHDPSDTVAPQRNFLENLVRHESGVQGSFIADAMLTRFTRDLWKLAQDGGLTLHDGNTSNPDLNEVSKALIAFAMQMYYENTANATNAAKELFTAISGGIQFDLADVSTKIKAAFDAGKAVNLNDAKGYALYFSQYLLQQQAGLSDVERSLIQSQLPYLRDWYVQAGAAGMNATDIQNRSAFMLGGTGADTLRGGSKADLLVGNAGADTLAGGLGNDTLLGGKDYDTYKYTSGDGFDTILDSDGNGAIYVDGTQLAGGAQYGDARVHRDSNKRLYVQVDTTTLVVDGSMIVDNYTPSSSAGALGLNMTGAVADVNPSTGRDIYGDFTPSDFDPATPGIQTQTDALGNAILSATPEPGRADTLNDSTGNDSIISGGGDDVINAFRGGDDLIDAGSGNDTVDAGAGNDVIIGGADSDILNGGADDDRLYADTQLDAASAIAQGNSQTGSGTTGDWLNGGAGDDTLVGSVANDLLAGGSGADLLIGGAGDDVLLGDNDALPANFPVQTWQYLPDLNTVLLENVQYHYPPNPADSGNDVLYAGEGNDIAFGGYGNDVLFGEGGADILQGNSGNDVLLGGAGKDTLYGDTIDSLFSPAKPGNDYLDGGAEDDFIYGNEGEDILIGGTGNDTLDGGSGADTMAGGLGDDSYIVDDVGDVVIEVSGEGTDTLFSSISITLPDNVEKLSLSGTANLDVTGNAGANTLIGNAGANRLMGMVGNDFLQGNANNDIYLFNRGDGQDSIDNTDLLSATDILRFGAGINDTDVQGFQVGMDMVLKVRGSTDQTAFINYYGANIVNGSAVSDHKIDSVEFANGVVWNQAMIQTIVDRATANHAPTVNTFLPTLQAITGSVFSYAVPTNTVIDADVWDSVTYSVKMPDGSAVPSWLTFDAASQTLSGAPALADVGSLQFMLWGTDTYGYGIGQMVTLDIKEPNRAPVLSTPVPDQAASQGNVFNYTLALTAFTDPDVGDTLNYSATLADGSALPAWLGFDAATRTFSGTPSSLGTTSIKITAKDAGNLSASDVFDIVVSVPSLIVNGTAGGDLLYGGAGNDFLYGDAGADFLYGRAGNDTLDGGTGDDQLFGETGDDILDGGSGDDTLQGGAGNDIYLFGIGDGQDMIIETGGNADVLRLKAGITPQQIALVRNDWSFSGEDSLALQLLNTNGIATGDAILIRAYFNADNDTQRVDRIEFADGSVWAYADIQTRMLVPTEKNDSNLIGYAGADVIDGLGGDDAIYGRAGNDTLLGGVGNDRLYGEAGNDSLDGGEGDDDVQGGWGDDTLLGGAGNDRLLGYDGSSGTEKGNDVLYGGAGNDRMFGGEGNDTYLFGRGDGFDLVGDTPNASGASTDVLRLSAGVLPEQVSLYRMNVNDLMVVIDGSNTQIQLSNYFVAGEFSIERIEFDGGAGAVWSAVDISARVQVGTQNSMLGTAGDDTFIVDHELDTITESASSGIDTVLASRAFTLPDNVENLTLTDVLNINATGNILDNILRGNSGDNVIRGGGGTDTAYGGLGNDIYYDIATAIEYAGEGVDTYVNKYGGLLPDNIENFWLDDGSGVYYSPPITATGNTLDNIIVGRKNIQTDTLDGGVGADTLIAEGGTFIVDNHSDKIILTGTASPLSRTVQSYINWTLQENIATLNLIGSNSINGIGNDLANTLTGNTADNVLDGGAGNDTINGGTGNDTLIGGAGSDTLSGGIGNDTYVVDTALDTATEYFGEGIDTVQSSVTYSLSANVENLTLTGASAINGTGNTFNNLLTGNAADNVLDGGAGNDSLSGGLGNDIYVVDSAGDIVTENANEGSDVVQTSITYTLGANVENLTLTGAAVINGTGNALGNILVGNAANNILLGGGGDDYLQGGAGNDYLDGGAGNDRYFDGETATSSTINNSDTYAYYLGSGADVITDYNPSGVYSNIGDSIEVGAGLSASDIVLSRADNDLVLSNRISQDKLTVTNYFFTEPTGDRPYRIDLLNFSDGTSWSWNDIDAAATIGNAPVVSVPLPDQSGQQGSLFSYQIPANAFTDVDAGDTLAYRVTLANGSVLPSWLDFNAATRILSGTPANGDVGVLSVKVTATDTGGLSVSDTLDLSIANINDAPLVSIPIADQNANQGSLFSFTIPANAFADVDAGDTLAYSATLSDGGALPNWLGFNAATRSFSGTPTSGDVGSLSIKVTATDLAGATIFDTFSVAVATGNNAPVVATPIADQFTAEDSVLSFQIPAATFADLDTGDTLAYSATLSDGGVLPNWLGFDTATRTFSGTPTNSNVGAIDLRVTATDGSNASVSDVFRVTVNNVNDAPVVSIAVADQATDEDAVFSFQIPAGTFADIDVGDVLTFSATLSNGSALPSWLSFNAPTRTFSGVPSNSDVGNLDIRLTATDGSNAAVSDIFRVTVNNVNDAPLVSTPIADQAANEGSLFTYAVPPGVFADIDIGDTLSYNAALANGTALPAWLAFNAATRTFNGTPTDAAAGDYTLRVTATDISGAAVFDDFVLSIADTLSTVQNGTASANILNGTNFKDTLNGLGGNDTLYGIAGDDWLDGGSGSDTMVGGTGNDTYVISVSTDVVTENANEGIDTVRSSISHTLGANVENLTLIGAGNVSATGNGLDNLLTGNSASNTLTGNAGKDILQGLSGNDILKDSAGNNLLDGGAGTDTLTGATGNELFIGGAGNDTLTTGSGYDMITFNRGDGADTVVASTGADNTLSLGGGIRNQDLAFRKSSKNLILDTGNGESITFQNWYSATGNRSVVTLQMIEEAAADFAPGGADPLRDNKVERFNFAGLATQFDQALAANPALTSWALSNALATFATGGSDGDALGGDLPYQYGRYGNLGNVGLGAAQTLLGSAQFGVSAQVLQDQASLGQGVARLG